MKKISKFFIFLLIFTTTLILPTFAGDWSQDGEYWKYSDNGVFSVSKWEYIKFGSSYDYYYFDEHGHMVDTIYKIDHDYYSFLPKGQANSKNKVTIDGISYETGNKGIIEDFPLHVKDELTMGRLVDDGVNKKLFENGAFVTNAFKLLRFGGKYYTFYFDAHGNMAKGLVKAYDNNYYYFENDGTPRIHGTVAIYGDEYGTIERGQLTSLPSTFTIERYYEDLKRDEQESKAAVEAEKIKESIAQANFDKFHAEVGASAEYNANPYAAAREASLEALRIAESEAAAAQAAAYQAQLQSIIKVKIKNKTFNTINLKNEDGYKLTITYAIPEVEGDHADLINNAITTNINKSMRAHYENYVDDLKANRKVKITDVTVYQDDHMIVFHFSGDDRCEFYINTVTYEAWVA